MNLQAEKERLLTGNSDNYPTPSYVKDEEADLVNQTSPKPIFPADNTDEIDAWKDQAPPGHISHQGQKGGSDEEMLVHHPDQNVSVEEIAVQEIRHSEQIVVQEEKYPKIANMPEMDDEMNETLVISNNSHIGEDKNN